MGRHEPLTSLALGRSPYDDVVEGEGEPDPQEPPREYDEHGRVFNDEMKSLNKDIIRAHNEVMMVIGVAEQDPGAPTISPADKTLMLNEYGDSTGRRFHRLGRLLVTAGTWGVNGVRHRILVYRKTATIPFIDMMQREWRIHSTLQLLSAGMPSFLGSWILQWSRIANHVMRNHTWLRGVIDYARLHLQIYGVMQRLDLIPGSYWFPSLEFFVPFSSASPFIAPPPLGSPGAQSVPQWMGKIAMSLGPFVAYYLAGCAWDLLNTTAQRQVHKILPHPWPSSISNLRPVAPLNNPPRQSFPESPTLGDADREIRHTQDPELEGDPLALNSEGAGEPVPVGTIRRQSTFSSRGGDDYATDEEDPEMVNPPLISFDVDTSEPTEPPAGIWSAELRPSNSGDSAAQDKEAPRYVVNTLTCLPSILAADILTSSLTHALLTPFDILSLRAMARAFANKFRLPMDDMFEVSLADGLASRLLVNLFQAGGLEFLICFGAWATITVIAQHLQFTDEEWNQLEMERARELSEDESETGDENRPS